MNESEYTPTDDAVRRKYARGMKSDGTPTQFVKLQKEFDRWLAKHDAELRAEIAAELRGELPVQLAETAGSDTGWLSDMQGCDPEVGGDTEWVSFFDDNANDIGSIDLYHIAEHAARITEGGNND